MFKPSQVHTCRCGASHVSAKCPRCGSEPAIRKPDKPQPGNGREFRIEIPGFIQSANDFFGRMHGTKRAAIVKAWHRVVRHTLTAAGYRRYEGGFPAYAECWCYYVRGQRRCDWDNTYATAKCTQDALVRCGVLPNDSPRYIAFGTMGPGLSDTGMAYTVFVIRPVGS